MKRNQDDVPHSAFFAQRVAQSQPLPLFRLSLVTKIRGLKVGLPPPVPFPRRGLYGKHVGTAPVAPLKMVHLVQALRAFDISPSCPMRMAWQAPFMVLNTRDVPSALAVTNLEPVALKLTSRISSLCPRRVWTHCPLATSHTCQHRTGHTHANWTTRVTLLAPLCRILRLAVKVVTDPNSIYHNTCHALRCVVPHFALGGKGLSLCCVG